MNIFSTLSVMLDEAERQMRKAGIDWTNPCKLLKPIERPKKAPKPRDYYRRSEAEALFTDERVPVDRRVFYGFLFLTGMRHDEAAGLRVDTIDWRVRPLPKIKLTEQAGQRPLEEDKRGLGLFPTIPVHPVLGLLVRRWLAEGFEATYGRPPQPDDYLVPSTSDVTRFRPKRSTLTQIRRDAETIGITPRTTHETRNTFLTLASEDAPELESIIDRITHQPPSGRASETYKRSFWLAKCEVMHR